MSFGWKMYFAPMMAGQNGETKELLPALMEPMKDSEGVLKTAMRRILRHGGQIGQQTVYAVLLMYHAFRRKGIPIYARSIIIGTLGYFLAIFDAVPDFSPILGYTDDLGVLSFGLVTIAAYINDEVRVKARKGVMKLFSGIDLDALQAVDAKL